MSDMWARGQRNTSALRAPNWALFRAPRSKAPEDTEMTIAAQSTLLDTSNTALASASAGDASCRSEPGR